MFLIYSRSGNSHGECVFDLGTPIVCYIDVLGAHIGSACSIWELPLGVFKCVFDLGTPIVRIYSSAYSICEFPLVVVMF